MAVSNHNFRYLPIILRLCRNVILFTMIIYASVIDNVLITTDEYLLKFVVTYNIHLKEKLTVYISKLECTHCYNRPYRKLFNHEFHLIVIVCLTLEG